MCLSYTERGNVLPQGDYPNLKDYGGVMGILSTTPTNTKKKISKKKLEI